MFISSLLVWIALMLGMIASYFLITGTSSVTIEEIRSQTKGGYWLADNVAHARSMMTDKSRAYYGFRLLFFSFLLQIIALFMNEVGFKKTIPMVTAIIISFAISFITYFITKFLTNNREKKELLKYQKIQSERLKRQKDGQTYTSID